MTEEIREKLLLKPGVVASFLTNFSWTPNKESFQMTELHMADKVVDAISAKSAEEAKDVLIIDLSLNSLSDCSALVVCTQLVKLNLAKNKIKSAAVFCAEENFPNLKWLDLSGNKLSEFPAFKCAKLEYLDVSAMKIDKINEAWTTHERLRVVKCVDNRFKSLALFKSMPRLEELYMGQNMITTLSGWENLPNLRKLHLRKNKIDKLPEEDLPDLPMLVYLNLRRNAIDKLDTVFKLF
jgi:protein phosphatase 1 regulatory subunit 7